MSDRFYTPQPLAPGEFILDGAEAHHLSSVRRFVPGDRLTLFNGDGFDYPAHVVTASKKTAVLNVLSPIAVDRELGFPLVVAAALPKGDRADYLIEKLTELGATRFVPLVTNRSVVQPKDAKIEKFERAVIEASKQCGRNVLMSIDGTTHWRDFLERADLPRVRLFLHPSGSTPLSEQAPAAMRSGVVLAIGPEGGFDSEELQSAVANGWRAVTLGSRVLRVETAAAAAVAWIGQLCYRGRSATAIMQSQLEQT